MARKIEKNPTEKEKVIPVEGLEEKKEEPKKEEKRVNRKRNEGKRTKRETRSKPEFDKEAWQPRTTLGRKVKSGEIKSIDEILDGGFKILEPEIIEALLPNLELDLIKIGQSKGKFGGGKRSIWKQTQKKTKEGNKPQFSTLAIAGNRDGYVGIGCGKAKETVPAREKAFRNAKLNVIKIRRGCGSWECSCGTPHSIPFKILGKSGSVKITLLPASKGTNLCVEQECAKLLTFAGIKDVYSKTIGQTKIKRNLIYACFNALKTLTKIKISDKEAGKRRGISEGKAK